MRKTPLFKAVIAILEEQKGPLSVPDLQTSLKQAGLSPHKTSLYRLLEKLKEQDLIEAVLLDSTTTFYELKTTHHHHFTCTDCTQIKCIDDHALENQIHQLEKLLRSKGLEVQSHHFSLTGKCQQCT